MTPLSGGPANWTEMKKVSQYAECESLDPIARMRAYQLAWKIRSACLDDAEVIRVDPITERIAGQLYTSVGSIAANLVEGYSRSSGRDRARIFEYALGSARESIEWYESSKRALEPGLLGDRKDALTEIVRMLLAIIPRERERVIRPAK